MWRNLGTLALVLALSACAENPYHLSTTFLGRYAVRNPTPSSFTECHGFGCTEISHVSLSPHEWQRVAAVLHPRAANATAERGQIANAIALMQRIVGAQTGTAVHQWTHENYHILPNLGDSTQLDCIDESVNTWTYLTMMQHAGFLHFHRVPGLSYVGLPTDIASRNTATLEQTGGGYYAIDPSLVDAGVPPPIIPLEVWLSSWPPRLSVNGNYTQNLG